MHETDARIREAIPAVVVPSSIASRDTAKAMSVLAANAARIRDYKVPADIPKRGPPIIAIPTTAGTGSEVTRFSR